MNRSTQAGEKFFATTTPSPQTASPDAIKMASTANITSDDG